MSNSNLNELINTSFTVKIVNAPTKKEQKKPRCESFMSLLKDTFRLNSPYQKEFEKMEYELQTKTLSFHLASNLGRVFFSSFGMSYWQKAFKGRDKLTNLNQEFVDQTESFV